MTIKATILNLQQGTQEWAEHRARSLNASELAAALGLSSYMTRSELVRIKATGITPEHDAATMRRFERGHATEAAAREIAEEIIGEALYSAVFTAEVEGLRLSASLDGHTLLNDITWEHKLINEELRSSLSNGIIPEQYHPQIEQGLMLTGAERCLFMASDGTQENCMWAWYESRPDLRAKILPTWQQFMADVAAYQPEQNKADPVVAKPVEGFGALTLRVEGRVLASNLDTFRAGAEDFLARLPKPHELQTDQDFATADAAAKACADAESRIKAAKDAALAQMSDVDAILRTADEVAASIRAARLALEKAVKSEKEARKEQIVREAQAALSEHITRLQGRVGILVPVRADFTGAIKGLKSLDSMRDKVGTVLANAKIEASSLADLIEANRRTVDDMTLVPDFAQVCTKSAEDFQALLALRRQQRAEAEERRRAEQEERERLRQEQAERRAAQEAEAAAKAAATEAKREADEQIIQLDDTAPATDDGERLTLGQINERLAPVSITVAGLAELGFQPVEQVKASRLYRASDLPSICKAISAHVLRACATTTA